MHTAADPGIEDRVVLSTTSLVAIAATFLLIGMVVSAYGPLLPILAHRFDVSLPIAGGVLSAHFAGALAGVVGSMRAMERLPNRHVVVAALGFVAVGCALVALAAAWPVMLAAVFFLGIGFGALDIGLNQIVAHSEGARRTALLNMLNGAFGLGAVLGPILVALFGEHHFALLYAGGAVLAVGLMGEGLRIPGRLPVAPRSTARRPRGLVIVFVIAFAFYVGTEAGVGGWSTSHLRSLGLGAATAAALTSGFWLAMAAGRLLVGLLPSRIAEWAVVVTGSALGVVALLAAVSGPAAPVAYLVTGLVIAPIFPTGVVWLARLLPGDSRATSWLFPGAMVGGAVIPAVIGFVITRVGMGGAPVVLSAVALGTFLAFSGARLLATRPSGR
ncbi:MAG TPA: MFS transporter [Candidatus Dormibacteraeota bacterium]|nr:MFS transporter [Candidatus Dormibacteraeota bacterium]